MITGFITKLVRTISISKVAMWSLTALLVIVLYTIFENRSRFVTKFTAPQIINVTGVTFSVGPETQIRLTELAKSSSNIAGIAVMSADLRLNEARSMFFFGTDPSLSGVKEAALRNDVNRFPLFTGIDESNIDIIKLINGQFSCTPFSLTLESRIYAKELDTIKAVCRSSIPSYYGYFSGYLQIYLTEAPSPEKELQLKLIAEKLANDIYFKDVLPTQKTEKLPQSITQFGP